MPKVIKIKRGDVNSLNNHILADGELAFTRHRVMEAGVQRGETVDDHYFRVGDGTQAGGIVPGAASIGVGLLFAIATASSATRQIEALVGEYWTPWKMKSFAAPYDPFRLTPIYRDCLTPDIYNSNINLHLGNGFLMFDGTAFEMRITGSRFLFESDWERKYASDGGSNSAIMFGYYNNLVDWTGGDGHRRCSSFLSATGNASTSTVSKQHMIGMTAQVANYSDVTCDAGICYVAQPTNPLTGGTQPGCKQFNTVVGYQVETWDSLTWFDGTPAHTTPPIQDFYGFRILDQTARMFRGLVHGFHIDSIDTTNYCQGMYMESIGHSSLATDGIYINRVGTNVARDSGATYAGGLTINNVGWYKTGNNTGSILARGIWLGDIRGKEEACGIRIGSVTATGPYNNGNPYTATMAIGVRIGNLKGNTGTGWGCGFLVSPDTTTLDVGGAIGYSVNGLDVVPTASPGDVYAVDIYEVGMTNAKKAHGFVVNKLGNLTTTTDTYGLYLGILKSVLNTTGIHVTNVQCDSASTSSAKGIYLSNIYGTQNSAAYGIFAEGIHSNNNTAAGVFLGDIYSSNTSNVSNIYGFYKQGQTDKYFKHFVVFGAGTIDYSGPGPVASSVNGIYFNRLGQNCYEANGVVVNELGVEIIGGYPQGTATIVRGILLNRMGNMNATTEVYGICVGNGLAYSLRSIGIAKGIKIGGLYSSKAFTSGVDQTIEVVGLDISLGRSQSSNIGVSVDKFASLGTAGHNDSTTIGFYVGYLGSGRNGTEGGDVIGFYKKTQGAHDEFQTFKQWEVTDDGGVGVPYCRRIVVFGAGGQDVYSGNASDTSTSVYGLKFGGMGERFAHTVYGSYYHVIGGISENSSQCVFARGHVVNAVFAGAANGTAYGFYMGQLGAGPSTGESTGQVCAFYKDVQSEETSSARNFHQMAIINVLDQDVAAGGDTSALIYGIKFNDLGNRYAKKIKGMVIGNIASDTSSIASDAYGIDFYGQIGNVGCTTTRGIHIGPTRGIDVYALKIDSVLGGTSTGIFISSITGSIVFGLEMGALDCPSGTNAKGIYISSIIGQTLARGLDIGTIANHASGSTSDGIYINSVTSSNDTRGFSIGNISTSNNDSTTYGIHIVTVASNSSTGATPGVSYGNSSRGIYFDSIFAPNGGAVGIHLQSVWGLGAEGLRLGGVTATTAAAVGLWAGDISGTTLSVGFYLYNVTATTGNSKGIEIGTVASVTGSRGINIPVITSSGNSSVIFGYNIDSISSDPLATGVAACGFRTSVINIPNGSAIGIGFDSIQSNGIVRGLYIGLLSSSQNVAYGIDISDVSSGTNVLNSGAAGYRIAGVTSNYTGTAANGFQATGIYSANGVARGMYIGTVNCGNNGESYGVHIQTITSNHGYTRGILIDNVISTNAAARGLDITDVTGSTAVRGINIEDLHNYGSGNILDGLSITQITRSTDTGDAVGIRVDHVYSGSASGNAYGIYVGPNVRGGILDDTGPKAYKSYSLYLDSDGTAGHTRVVMKDLPVGGSGVEASTGRAFERGELYIQNLTNEVHMQTT